MMAPNENLHIDESLYDAILVVRPSLNEANVDKRMAGPGINFPGWGSQSGYLNYYGPEIYGAFSFGNTIKRAISGNGVSCQVSDFGPWVVVRVTYSNVATGREGTKTFLIVFQDKSKGIVLSTANKWRTIDGYQQAVSYINSAISSLRNGIDSVL